MIKQDLKLKNKTRNTKIQQQSKTQNEAKVENLQWVKDEKNHTNELHNYLTEFKDANNFLSSPESPSEQAFETFDAKQTADYPDRNNSRITQSNADEIYYAWHQRNQSRTSNLICITIIGDKNGELTLSPADVNKLFNAMQLNSFDKRILFPKPHDNKVPFISSPYHIGKHAHAVKTPLHAFIHAKPENWKNWVNGGKVGRAGKYG